jgi:hypothetical protein
LCHWSEWVSEWRAITSLLELWVSEFSSEEVRRANSDNMTDTSSLLHSLLTTVLTTCTSLVQHPVGGSGWVSELGSGSKWGETCRTFMPTLPANPILYTQYNHPYI